MRLLVAVIATGCAVLGLGAADASSSTGTAADCVPLPEAKQGSFRRSDTPSFRLVIGSCVFGTTLAGTSVHDGDYTVTSSSGSASGRMLVSHDQACVGEENYPTSYDYAFTRGAGVLRLTLADQADFCSGRQQDLGSESFVRALSGPVRILTRGATFAASGVMADSGRYDVVKSKAQPKGRKVTLRLRGTKGVVLIRVTRATRPVHAVGSWKVLSATGAYLGLTGAGRESGPLSSLRPRVILTGRVTNI
jgi:hypothetical protein